MTRTLLNRKIASHLLRLAGTLALFVVLPASRAQTPADSLLRNIPVDTLPRVALATTPAVAFDRAGNFAVVWKAQDKGTDFIRLRRFDAAGAPITRELTIATATATQFINDPSLAFAADGNLWIVWSEITRQDSSAIVAEILDPGSKPIQPRLVIVDSAKTSLGTPAIVADSLGRVLVAWGNLELTPQIFARFYDVKGQPTSPPLLVSQSLEASFINDRFDVALSSQGSVAVTWHAIEAGNNLIYLRTFKDNGEFITPPVVVEQGNVVFPRLAFVTAEAIVLQWFESAAAAVLRARQFDLNVQALTQTAVVAAGSLAYVPAAIAATEENVYFSVWAESDPRLVPTGGLFVKVFDIDNKEILKTTQAVRTTENLELGIQFHAAVSPNRELAIAYNGNDGDVQSPFPRVGVAISPFVLPDLQARALTVEPGDPTRVDSLKINLTIDNASAMPAGKSEARLLLNGKDLGQPLAVAALLPNESRQFAVRAAPQPPGEYTLELIVDARNQVREVEEKNNTISASIKVQELPILDIAPATLSFTGTVGQGNPLPQTLQIQNIGGDTLNWSAQPDQSWLSINPPSGQVISSQSTAEVSVDVTALPAGTHRASIRFASDGGEASVAVTLRLNDPALADLEITALTVEPVTPTRSDSLIVRFTATNSGGAAAPASSALVQLISTSLMRVLTLPAFAPGDTARFEVKLGKAVPGAHTLVVTLDQAQVVPESNEQNNTRTLSITVIDAATLAVTPRELTFAAVAGEGNPTAQPILIENVGSDTLNWSANTETPWLQITPASGGVTTQAQQVTVVANIAGLPVGEYQGTIGILSNGGVANVNIRLVITSPTPVLVVKPDTLKIAATAGGANPPAGKIAVSNGGGGVFQWTVQSNQPWLTVLPANGTVSDETDEIVVSANIAGLNAGDYTAMVNINGQNAGQASVVVALTISPEPAVLEVNPTRLTYVATEGSVNPAPQRIGIRNLGGGTLEWTASSSFVWLSNYPLQGTTTSEVDSVEVYASMTTNPPAGTYTGNLVIDTNAGSQQIEVIFIINPPIPVLAVSPATMDFTVAQGEPVSRTQSLLIHNVGGGQINWTVSSDKGWLLVSPATGQLRSEVDTVSVAVAPRDLLPGTYFGTVSISSTAGNFTLPIRMVIASLPDLRVLATTAELDNCFASDYNYRAVLEVQNFGQLRAQPATARLLINGVLRQELPVPPLDTGERFGVAFATESLPVDSNRIHLVVVPAPGETELSFDNNEVTLLEWVPERGDANLDGEVDLADVFAIVDMVLERKRNYSSKACWAANLVVDTSLDIFDILKLIEQQLNRGDQRHLPLAGKITLQPQQHEEMTTLRWQSDVPLRGWMAAWQLNGHHLAQNLRTERLGELDLTWKIDGQSLKLLVRASEGGVIAPNEIHTLALNGVGELGKLSGVSAVLADDRLVQLEIDSFDNETSLPRDFALSSGFPNPAALHGKSTAIRWQYDLPEATAVEMVIYNLLGQEVRRFQFSDQTPGRKLLAWDGKTTADRRVAPGIYFLRMQASDYVKITRFIVQ